MVIGAGFVRGARLEGFVRGARLEVRGLGSFYYNERTITSKRNEFFGRSCVSQSLWPSFHVGYPTESL